MKDNYYKLDLQPFLDYLGGGARYVDTFSVGEVDQPVLVFECPRHKKRLGHRRYPFILPRLFIGSMSPTEFRKEVKQLAVKCPQCRDVLVSRHRHDLRVCKCGNVRIDGGKNYCRVFGGIRGIYNWDTKEFIPHP